MLTEVVRSLGIWGRASGPAPVGAARARQRKRMIAGREGHQNCVTCGVGCMIRSDISACELAGGRSSTIQHGIRLPRDLDPLALASGVAGLYGRWGSQSVHEDAPAGCRGLEGGPRESPRPVRLPPANRDSQPHAQLPITGLHLCRATFREPRKTHVFPRFTQGTPVLEWKERT